MTWQPSFLPIWIAIEPTPLVPAITSNVSPDSRQAFSIMEALVRVEREKAAASSQLAESGFGRH